MVPETRTVCFDADLNIEAYSFKGIRQKFPTHFHEYYVIGFIENGRRELFCKNKHYIVERGTLIIFNPQDSHMCQQLDNEPLDYRCINISVDTMQKIVREITQKTYLPYFTEPVLCDSELVAVLHDLHEMLMQQEKDFKKDELFLLLMEDLLFEHADTIFAQNLIEPSAAIKIICNFLQTNYSENIKLNDLSQLANMSKYHLLRSFTKQKGISPYCYLETIRISAAKKLLEQQCSPLNVALQTGFSDQSHFSNFFKKIIGLTPKQYMNIFTTETKRKK